MQTRTSYILVYSQNTNWIYHVIIETINNMFLLKYTTNRVVIFEHATYAGSGEGLSLIHI